MPSLSRESGEEERRVVPQTEAGQGVLRPPSFGPDEAAPFQQLCEDKKSCAQVRIGPSLCLAESGWKSTYKGKIGRDGKV